MHLMRLPSVANPQSAGRWPRSQAAIHATALLQQAVPPRRLGDFSAQMVDDELGVQTSVLNEPRTGSAWLRFTPA